jgi:phosphoglycerate dehydrogenase-like enzyme
MAESDSQSASGRAQIVVSLPIATHYQEQVRAAVPGMSVRFVEDGALTADDVAMAEAIAAWRFDASLLTVAERLRWLQTGGAGVDTLPLDELARRGVTLTNNSGVHAPNIAEHTLAMMLAFARQLPRLVRAQDRHVWRDTETHAEVFELNGQTLLLLGLGDIGLAIASRAVAFNLRVIGVRRRDLPVSELPIEVASMARLAELLAVADHVVTSLPLTKTTRGLLGAEQFATMKPGAFVYNVGRGPVIDTDALISALASGHLGGAGLDVVDPEPLPADSPLWDMRNVLITSHTSGASPNYWERGAAILIENARRFGAGEPLLNVVDLDAGY